MVYFSLLKKVLMAEIYVACFGFKNKDWVFQIPSILQWQQVKFDQPILDCKTCLSDKSSERNSK